MDNFKGKVILITGGTGSLGRALVARLLTKYKPAVIRVFSRDELKQWEMRQQFKNHPALRFLIGDVRDAVRLRRASEGIDYLIHAAALKQVPACEYNPIEAVRTNIDGAINVINACLDNNVKKVINVSTDKACAPINVYGATKLGAERLFLQSNSYQGPNRDTVFSVVRYGNVLGSRGSVIPIFKEQKPGGVLTLTDERMTRFWITLPQAVDFILSCFNLMQGGELFVPKIPSMRMVDLARALAPQAKFKIIGIRPGEKLHESLITKEEGRRTYELKDRYVVFSDSLDNWQEKPRKLIDAKPAAENFEYNSLDNRDYLSQAEIKKMLRDNNLS
jgi:UDP-N-acetylglucosamine 4,6-dehydratase/5-epimerase